VGRIERHRLPSAAAKAATCDGSKAFRETREIVGEKQRRVAGIAPIEELDRFRI
jgi:hypothetical protein